MAITTKWRGVTLDVRTANQMMECAKIVGKDVYVQPTQGSYRPRTNYSGGTHCGGGAIDISVINLNNEQELRLIEALNDVGMIAWVRPFIRDLWPRHIHALSIPVKWVGPGNLDPSAWQQVKDCRAGYDGLASRGPDPHKKMRTWVTWEQYQNNKAKSTAVRKEDEMNWNDPIPFKAAAKGKSVPTYPASQLLGEAASQATYSVNMVRDLTKRVNRLEEKIDKLTDIIQKLQ